MNDLPAKAAEHRFEVLGRQVVARTSWYGDRQYVDRICQVVKRPRAYSEVQRKLWPTAKPNAIALAALSHLGASSSGFIAAFSPPSANQERDGDSRSLSASELRSM